MPVSINNKEIIKTLYRTTYSNNVYYFADILKAAIRVFVKDESKIDIVAKNKETNIWNELKRHFEEDESKGIVPLFSIISENDRTVKWIGGDNCSDVGKALFESRPNLYRMVDDLNDREYVIFACFICKLLGADKVTLTPKGNEGGVDFYARIPSSLSSHYFWKMKGPIRVVGQCKKYKVKDNVADMKEFITTLRFIYDRAYHVGETLPEWFKMEKGIIVGWHISDQGHQAGALDIAKNYGVLVSDTKELIDIICRSPMSTGEANITEMIRQKYLDESLYYDN